MLHLITDEEDQSMLASVIGAVVIWTFTVTVYSLGVPANALLAA